MNFPLPSDIKKMNSKQLDALCVGLRRAIIDGVARSGGHLASNLGVVELTVALHRVFDTSYDRLVFDVGHQCYAHKLLTGRAQRFDTLRKLGGLSGFPDPDESVHDAFRAGHASTAVSAALGIARARTLTGEGYSVIAVVGDGALTGGMTYEALADAGQSREPMIVVLNDNEMSIGSTAGGVQRMLGRLRLKPGYMRFKDAFRKVTRGTAPGRVLYNFVHNSKVRVKNLLLHGSMFEDMGFTYLGPVDGHDIDTLTGLFDIAKGYDGPVLIHIKTLKGKGYMPAELNPSDFHGLSGFDVETGECAGSSNSFSAVFGDTLCQLARSGNRICAVTAAMQTGTGLDRFAAEFPERFFDVGITEEHAATMAAGLASKGARPVYAVYSTFAQRSYDQLIHDVALQRLPVVVALDRAGPVGEDGATHHGIFDVPFLTHIPGVTVFCPSSFAELRGYLIRALDGTTPAVVRYPRGCEGGYTALSEGGAANLRGGDDLTLVSYGIMINEVCAAADILERQGVFCEVVKLNIIAPLDIDAVLQSVRRTGRLVVVEDCVANGGIGQQIAARLSVAGVTAKVRLLNMGGDFPPHGTVTELRRLAGIDADGVVAACLQLSGVVK